MWQILEKALNNTISTLLMAFIIVVILVFVGGMIYIPLGIIKINKQLKEIKEIIKKKDGISLD